MIATTPYRPLGTSFLPSFGDFAAALLFVVAAAALYSINLDRLPHPDELHHILAARGLLESGEPRIAEGLYTRAILHTWLVAWSYELFGVSLAAARVPSLIAIALLNGVFFLWLVREAGRPAAYVATALWALSPFAIAIAQFSRFYALQGLVFFIGAWFVYAAVLSRASLRRRVLLGLASLPFLGLAADLQPTTAFGLVGLAAWAIPVLFLPWFIDRDVPARRRLALGLAAVLAAVALLAIALAVGLLDKAWAVYRSTQLFNEGAAGEFWFYHAHYSLLYPSLWPLVGILGLAAAVRFPRPAGFALTVFAVGFLLNSFAATKSLRYLFYAQVYLFVSFGIGLVVVAPALWRFVRDLAAQLAERFGSRARPLARPLGNLLVAGAVAFLLLANPAWLRSTLLLTNVTIPPEEPKANWPVAYATLLPYLETVDVVITTEELGALYFLGRFDVRFSPSKLPELMPDERHEFGRDFRTGRPVIAENASVRRLVACYRSGLVVGPRRHLGMDILINRGLEAYLRSEMQTIELPRNSRLYAFTWDHGAGYIPDKTCDDLPVLAGPAGLTPPGH